MISLTDPRGIERLYSAIDVCRDALRPFRKNRKHMIQEFLGSYYNNEAAQFEVLVNLLNLTADVYTIGLAANNPLARVTTDFRDLWPFAFRWRQAINNLVEEMRFAETLQAIVLDAFFSIGVAKVFQGDGELIQLEDDVWADPGRQYIQRISIDRFGLDMSVEDIRRCRFMWDEYRVSWESVSNNPDFEKSVVKQLSPTSKWDRGEDESAHIITGSIVDDDEYEPMVDLMDVWLPEIQKVAIFPLQKRTKPLKVVDPGLEGGPYECLTFADVPDMVMPSAPAQNLMGLHLLYNGLIRKQARQARRQKTNPTYRPTAKDDAERFKRYSDGDWIKVNDPQGINVVSQGGVDQVNVAFSIGVLDMFDRQAGNLQAMAGLGPQAPTLGQEELIYSAVSRKEAKMQGRVNSFVSKLMGSLGHLMWADAMLHVPASKEYRPGTGVMVDMDWTPELREGDFWQYNFDIVPYSTQYEPPAVKIQKIERAIDRISQLYPVLQAAGGSIDVQELVRQYADCLDIPELENIITFAAPPMVERPGPASPEGAVMPANTTRNYVRRNVPTGGTPQSRNAILQQSFLGGGQTNGRQRASLFNAQGGA